jgi:hypothetical protein
MHVKPHGLKQLAEQFSSYYANYPNRLINYHFDHTATGKFPNPISMADEFTRAMEALGWKIQPRYMGQAPGHDDKFELIDKALGEEDERLPAIRINEANCEHLIGSLENAPLKRGMRGFEKDKSSERDPNTQPEEATHYSDAFDMLIWGMLNGKVQAPIFFGPTLVS